MTMCPVDAIIDPACSGTAPQRTTSTNCSVPDLGSIPDPARSMRAQTGHLMGNDAAG
jgi:hypothetical protein